MSKPVLSLEKISVASPCRASWEDMVGTDRARFCMQCRQHVYNLSGMSRSEAEALIRSKEGRLCARFYRRQDGTVMTRDCPFGVRALGRRLAWVLGIAAAFFFAIGAIVFAARSQPEHGDRGFSWEFFRNLFAPAPPPKVMVMGDICPPAPPVPPANQPGPQQP
jgi:hypothetical protein